MTIMRNPPHTSATSAARATGNARGGWLRSLNRITLLAAAQPVLREWVLAATLVVVALAVNFHHLAGWPVWYDEDYSFGIASQSLPVMWRSIWGPLQNMTLYYVFLHGWLDLLRLLRLAPTEILLRGPSVVFAAFSVVIVYLIGRRFWGVVAGLVAATLYLFSYWQIYAAQDARSYGLQMLLLGLGWYALFAALDAIEVRSRRMWLVVYAVTMALAVYAHLWSGFILLAQMCALAGMLLVPGRWQAPARQSLRDLILSLGAILLLIFPIALDAKLHGGASYWVPPAQLRDLTDFLVFTFGGNGWTFALLAALAVGGVMVTYAHLLPHRFAHLTRTLGLHAGGIPSRERPEARADNGVLALLCWLIIPLALSFALTQPALNRHLFYSRYLMAVGPAFWLLVGVGVSALRWRAIQLAGLVALVALMALRVPSYYAQLAALPNPNYRLTTDWLQAHMRQSDGLVCFGGDQCSPPIDYYLHAYPGPAHFEHDAPGIWQWNTLSPAPDDPSQLAAYSARHARICLLLAKPPTVPAPTIQAWFDAHATLDGEFVNHQVFPSGFAYAVSVRCYLTRGNT